MISTVSIKKSDLRKLPDEVLRLVKMGQYTLYRVAIEEYPDICYVLRAGERELFFLQEDGEPVKFDSSLEFIIQEKILIEDVAVISVVPNFNRF
jgi:hypothetical protein